MRHFCEGRAYTILNVRSFRLDRTSGVIQCERAYPAKGATHPSEVLQRPERYGMACLSLFGIGSESSPSPRFEPPLCKESVSRLDKSIDERYNRSLLLVEKLAASLLIAKTSRNGYS